MKTQYRVMVIVESQDQEAVEKVRYEAYVDCGLNEAKNLAKELAEQAVEGGK